MQQSDSAIGQVIDGYRILEVLGKGGMGIVYKAEDVALSRPVALKMINPELASNESFLRRFHSEARALARAESPYIVGIHALRQAGERVFIVMEYVDGWTLADEIEKGAIPLDRTRSLLEQMLQAFIYAHSEGVIHRDIKPRNIMITREGKVKVTDFGLAKVRRDDGASTVTKGMAGTIRYMSPEQVQGVKADHRSDIYSLGMTLYEMLTGQLPFGFEEGTFTILKRIVEEEFTPPDRLNDNVPASLAGLTMKAISKSPDDRFQSAEEMLRAVGEAYRNIQSSQHRSSFVNVRPQPPKKLSTMQLVMMVVGVVLIAAAYPLYSLVSSSPEPVEPPPGGEDSTLTTNTDPPEPPSAPVLSVYTEPPGAQVFVGESTIGSSPITSHELSEGTVAVSLRLNGYSRVDTTLSVERGQHAELVLRLAKIEQPSPDPPDPPDDNPPRPVTGVLRVRAVPAGRITVGGRSYQDTASPSLTVGPYQVQFFDPNSGVSRDTTITVRQGSAQEVVCYFEHQVSFNTRWPDADIAPFASFSLNGGELEQTPAQLSLTPGVYNISASRQGFRILNDEQTLVIRPTFDTAKTDHRIFFEIRKEP